MIILTLITLALAVPAYWLALRYNMHMFQLNTYKIGEQGEWIKKNFHMQWILVFAMALGFVSMLLSMVKSTVLNVICVLIIWLTLAVIILVYRLMVEMSSKKAAGIYTASKAYGRHNLLCDDSDACRTCSGRDVD